MIGIVEQFKQLVPISNPSGEETRIRQFIQEQLLAFGIEHQDVDESGNLLAMIPGNLEKETILLSAHMDSVPPCKDIQPVEDYVNHRPIIRSDRNTILGADDKAGIAAILNLAERIHKNGYTNNHPLELLFSTQEEIGLIGLKNFDFSKLRSSKGYVLDGDGSVGDIFYGGPSQKNIKIDFKGVRAHAGIAPEAGLSAIDMAINTCARLYSGRIDSETTMNIGTIIGGDALNIVSPSATLYAEARSHNNKALEELVNKIKSICLNVKEDFKRGEIDLTVTDRYSSFEVSQTSQVIVEAVKACKVIGVNSRIAKMNIGSDAHLLNHGGIPTIVLGMGFHLSHSLGEFIYVDELVQVSDILWQIVQ